MRRSLILDGGDLEISRVNARSIRSIASMTICLANIPSYGNKIVRRYTRGRDGTVSAVKDSRDILEQSAELLQKVARCSKAILISGRSKCAIASSGFLPSFFFPLLPRRFTFGLDPRRISQTNAIAWQMTETPSLLECRILLLEFVFQKINGMLEIALWKHELSPDSDRNRMNSCETDSSARMMIRNRNRECILVSLCNEP